MRVRTIVRIWAALLAAALLAGCAQSIEDGYPANLIGDMRPLCGDAAPAATRVTGLVRPILTTDLSSFELAQVAAGQFRGGAWALDEYVWQTGLARIWLGPPGAFNERQARYQEVETVPLEGCGTWLNRVTLETIARRIDRRTMTYAKHVAPFGKFLARHFRAKGGSWRCISINAAEAVATDTDALRVLHLTMLDCRHPRIAEPGQKALIEALARAQFAPRE